jgi:hypothetical protein
MSALSLRLPNSLHRKLSDLARREGVSINQLVNSAVAEKMATLLTVEYLQERASRGTRKKFEAILGKVPDREPEVMDRLPNQRPKRTSRKRRRSTASVRRRTNATAWFRVEPGLSVKFVTYGEIASLPGLSNCSKAIPRMWVPEVGGCGSTSQSHSR